MRRPATHKSPAVVRATVLAALAGTLVVLPTARAEELELTLDTAATKVTFELPATGHDVHGLAHVSKGAIRFDAATGTASGGVTVDATTAETGNGSRDNTMREDVLEIAKFPTIVFVAERVEGTVAPEGVSQVKLHGQFDLHGTQHPLVMPAKVEIHDGKVTGTTSFPVPYQAWGLKDPSIMFLSVAESVEVHIELHGALAPIAAPAAAGGH